MLSLRSDGPLPAAPLSSDLAAIVFTSGSTGVPKGVTLTHRNMTFVADSIIEYLEMDESERVMCVLPLSFGYGLYQLLTCVRAGATLILQAGLALPRPRDPAAGRRGGHRAARRADGLQRAALAPRSRRDGSSRASASSPTPGAALPAATDRRAQAGLSGRRLYSMYGQTECQRVCYLPPSELDARPTSVGIAIPGTRAWVEDPEGGVAAPGVVGELMVVGDHVMQGYWNDPEATAAKIRPGRWPWERVMATGDLFRTDEDGFLYFVARRDDIIKSGGEKVPPREVEEVLHTAAGVREAAVVGMPGQDARRGRLRPRRPRYRPRQPMPRRFAGIAPSTSRTTWSPASVVFHEQLPRTDNGKLDRQALAAACS